MAGLPVPVGKDAILIEGLRAFRECSATILPGKTLLLYTSNLKDQADALCIQPGSQYQSLRCTELGKKLVELDLFNNMHGVPAYIAWTVATTLFLRANFPRTEISILGNEAGRESLVWSLEVPHVLASHPQCVVRYSETGDAKDWHIVGHETLKASCTSYIADFLRSEGRSEYLRTVWAKRGRKTLEDAITTLQRHVLFGVLQDVSRSIPVLSQS